MDWDPREVMESLCLDHLLRKDWTWHFVVAGDVVVSSHRLDSKISEVFSNLIDSVNLDSASELSFPLALWKGLYWLVI